MAPEDVLRLNVLLANKPLAIRINEASMTVFALTDKGVNSVVLNPTTRHEAYIKQVKELLSGHVLGSPGGYPVYLQRWTRMGQMRDDSLEDLLLLGEPEAVVAAVCAQGISAEIAARAWWAMEDAENARRLLEKKVVVESDLGRTLAEYLIEYLPFETESDQIIRTIALVLQQGLISSSQREELWKRAARKSVYYAGFMIARTEIPITISSWPLVDDVKDQLNSLATSGNTLAIFLLYLGTQEGQAWLHTVLLTLKKPTTQDVVTTTLDQLSAQFSCFRPEGDPDLSLCELEAESSQHRSTEMEQILEALPQFADALTSCRWLSGMGYGALRPLIKDSTAIGSLMRKKMAPMLSDINRHISQLGQS